MLKKDNQLDVLLSEVSVIHRRVFIWSQVSFIWASYDGEKQKKNNTHTTGASTFLAISFLLQPFKNVGQLKLKSVHQTYLSYHQCCLSSHYYYIYFSNTSNTTETWPAAAIVRAVYQKYELVIWVDRKTRLLRFIKPVLAHPSSNYFLCQQKQRYFFYLLSKHSDGPWKIDLKKKIQWNFTIQLVI